MTKLLCVVFGIGGCVLFSPCSVKAQSDSLLDLAHTAYEAFEYDSAVALTDAALNGRLPRERLGEAWELRAFSFYQLGSMESAITSFEEVVRENPDKDYDPDTWGARMVALHRQALANILVVRFLEADSARFVAGEGQSRIRFQLSRPANVTVTLVGPGTSMRLDSLRVGQAGALGWSGLGVDGSPIPAGRYVVLVEAEEFSDSWQRGLSLRVTHGAVDTLSHIDSIPGMASLPEFEQPGRSFVPFQIGAIAASALTGIVLAFEGSAPTAGRRELLAFDALSLISGLALSLRRPAPRPVESSILFNNSVRELVAQRNREIAAGNAHTRAQVLLTIVPEPVP